MTSQEVHSLLEFLYNTMKIYAVKFVFGEKVRGKIHCVEIWFVFYFPNVTHIADGFLTSTVNVKTQFSYFFF
jgi:hypothetical protein